MNKLKNFLIAGPENNYQPPIISYKAFIVYGALLLLLRIFLSVEFAGGASVDSQTLMKLINSEREQRNLTVLATKQSLLTAAGQKSQDMIDRDYFAHIDPDGNYVWNKIISAGYSPYKILGENLAINFTSSEGMIKAWLDSPTHRANLLHTDFRDQGLSALYGDYNGSYTNLTTSLFGALIASAEPAKNEPPAEQPPAPAPPQPVPVKPAPTPSDDNQSDQNQPPVFSEPVTTPDEKQEAAQPTSTEPSSSSDEIRGGENQKDATTTKLDTVEQTPSNTESETSNNSSALDIFQISKIIFTVFGAGLLSVLSTDSYIIQKHDIETGRSHSSYHLLAFALIILVSILIWWW